MKTIFFLILLLFSANIQAQEDSVLIDLPNTICLDHEVPFFDIPEDIMEFSFMIFNRWGELLFETDDPGFSLGNDLSEDERFHFKDLENYYFRLSYERSGDKREYTGILLLFMYCNCG